MNPLVYLREDQINWLFKQGGGTPRVFEGAGYAWDSGTVYHAYTQTKTLKSAAVLTPVRFVVLDALPSVDAVALAKEYGSHRDVSTLLIFLAVEDSVLRHKCYSMSP